MAFGDIMSKIGLVNGKPDEGQNIVAQMLLEQRNKKPRGFSDSMARSLSMMLGIKMLTNSTKAAENARTEEQKAIAVAMGVNPLAYEAKNTLEKLGDKTGEYKEAREISGQLGILSATAKTLGQGPGLGGLVSGGAGAIIDPMQADAAKKARAAQGQRVALQNKAGEQQVQQKQMKQAAIQKLMASKDPEKVKLAMQIAQQGKPTYKIAGNKVVELRQGQPPRVALDLADKKPIRVGKNEKIYDPVTKELLFEGGGDDPKLWKMEGLNPETGKPEHMIMDENGNVVETGVQVLPKVSTLITKEGKDLLVGDKPLAREFTKQKVVLKRNIKNVDMVTERADPKFFNVFKRMGYGIDEGLSKFIQGGPDWLKNTTDALGVAPTKDEMAALAEYKGFEGSVKNFNNRYIKDITGAQMSEPEAQRIMAAIGNMGDSFTAFNAKNTALKELMEYSKQLMEDELSMLQGEGYPMETAGDIEKAKALVADSVQARVGDKAWEISNNYKDTGNVDKSDAPQEGDEYD